MGFRFSPDGEVIYIPEDIRDELKDEVAAVNAEAGEESRSIDMAEVRTESSAPAADREPADKPERVPATAGASRREEEDDDDLPQTQMAAAFAALNMEDLAIERSPEADPA